MCDSADLKMDPLPHKKEGEKSRFVKLLVHTTLLVILLMYQGSQMGLIQRRLEEMYVECAEVVLSPCFFILKAVDPERFIFIFDEMREKVLETEVD